MSNVASGTTFAGLVEELAHGLRRAARELGSDGKPALGAAYLRQALALLPGEAARAALLDLAGLETTFDMQSAAEHFTALLAQTGDVAIVADAASALLALHPSVRDERVWHAATRAIALCDDADLRLRLRARLGANALLTVDADDLRADVLPQLAVRRSETPGEKAALGVTAFDDLWRGRPLCEVRRSGEALYCGDWVPSLRGSGAAYWVGTVALVTTDSPLVPQAIDEVLAYARRHASSGAESGVLVLRAHARLRAGDLAGGAADGRTAYELFKAYGGGPVPLAYAIAAEVQARRESGDIDGARAALARAPPDTDAGTLGIPGIRYARACLRAAGGAPEPALDELLRIGADYEALRGGSPALLPWRSTAALLAHRLGHDTQARELARDEVSAAADAGPRALGRALAASAATGPEEDALAVAARAVTHLHTVDAPIELAQALLVQGRVTAALASADASRPIFAHALELAERSGARPLALAARDELVRVGGRPRRGASIGIDGLTAAERAVARSAAGGLSNREIAAALHIAPGTVKNHLASVYRKLSITSRSQLPDALG